VAREAWAPQEKKGESKGDYQKRYYKAQRVHAEETGDQKTTDKIYSKLGKKSHSVDSNATDKAILGTVATGSLGKLGALAKLGKGAKAIGETKALGAGRQALGKARPASIGAKKALTGGRGMAREAESPTSMKNVTPKRLPSTTVKGGVPRHLADQARAVAKNKNYATAGKAAPRGRTSGVIKRGKTESYHTKSGKSMRPSAKSASIGKKGEGVVKEVKKKKAA
jgi:hypothetical protein